MKKALWAISFLLILLVGGCAGGTPLTKQEYFDAVQNSITAYTAAALDIAQPLYEYEINGTPFDREELQAISQNTENMLLKIKTLVPPQEYSGYHDKLCDGVDSILPWFDALDTVLNAASKTEFSQAGVKMREASERSTLLSEWMEFVIAVSDEVELKLPA